MVFRTLANAKEESNGKWIVPHFDEKAEVNKAVEAQGFQYTAFVYAAFYYQNLQSIMKPEIEGDKVISKLTKTSKIAMFDVEDTGPIVAKVFEVPEEYNGKHIPMAGDELSTLEIAQAVAKSVGKQAHAVEGSLEDCEKQFGKEMAHMFGWFNEFGYMGKKVDVQAGRKAYPGMKTFEQFLKENKLFG